MTKYFFTILVAFILWETAKSQPTDTVTTYYKQTNGFLKKTVRDSAEFLRMILPPDDGDDKVNVREYNMNGQLLGMGKFSSQYRVSGVQYKTGPYITFYPNGKKRTVINYVSDVKEGDEYLFYPNGRVLYYMKNVHVNGEADRTLSLECYDVSGNSTCKDGNGKWLVYNKGFTNIIFSGPVANGRFDGVWNGKSEYADSCRYTSLFEKGVFKEGKGYDKSGKPHTFYDDIIEPQYPEKMITFLRQLRSRIDFKIDDNGQKMALDSIIISFIVEHDGSLSNGEIVNYKSSQATENLNAVLAKFKKWIPRQHYGIPFRSKITIPIKEQGAYTDAYNPKNPRYRRNIIFNEKVLDFN